MVNISEGRDHRILELLEQAGGTSLLDVHVDPDHHRSVFTMAGPLKVLEDAVREVASVAVEHLDIEPHEGLHPRLGIVDVVPFIPLALQRQSPTRAHRRPEGRSRTLRPRSQLAIAPSLDSAVRARDAFSQWFGSVLKVPCFHFGPLPQGGYRSLPDIRRSAFSSIPPESGPHQPHPTAGACAVGARRFLIAYNIWVSGSEPEWVRSVAAEIRGPAVRALAFPMSTGPGVMQVSCNLVDPFTIGPAEIHDRVARLVDARGGSVERCELVGLMPSAVLEAIPPRRWAELDVAPESTLEARLEGQGILVT
ncbi:MAG: hypothetical protein ACYDHU_01155 [Acidimicrobiales bacterium]